MTSNPELPTIQLCVARAMRDYAHFRLHEHREGLLYFLRKTYPGIRFSQESINRCQRKLWHLNPELRPQNKPDRATWEITRNEYAQHYKAYAQK